MKTQNEFKNKTIYEYHFIDREDFEHFWQTEILPKILKFNKDEYYSYIEKLKSEIEFKVDKCDKRGPYKTYLWDLHRWLNGELQVCQLTENEWEECKSLKISASYKDDQNLRKIKDLECL